MDIEEIIFYYKTAADQDAQIQILADLTNSDVDTIITILKEHGIYKKGKYRLMGCSDCGTLFYAVIKHCGSTRCEKCRYLHKEHLRKERYEKKALAKSNAR